MTTDDRSPARRAVTMGDAYQVLQTIHTAASLRIADLLRDGPRDVDDLAAATATSGTRAVQAAARADERGRLRRSGRRRLRPDARFRVPALERARLGRGFGRGMSAVPTTGRHGAHFADSIRTCKPASPRALRRESLGLRRDRP